MEKKKIDFSSNLLAVLPHTDDELFFWELIQKFRNHGREVDFIFCSLDEKRSGVLKNDPIFRQSLFLNLPDTKLYAYGEHIRAHIEAALLKKSYGALSSFDPVSGYYGHPDHMAVGKVTEKAAVDFSLQFIFPYPSSLQRGHLAQHSKAFKRLWNGGEEVKDEDLISMKISDVSEKKAHLQKYQTQITILEDLIPLHNASDLFGEEYYIIR